MGALEREFHFLSTNASVQEEKSQCYMLCYVPSWKNDIRYGALALEACAPPLLVLGSCQGWVIGR